MKKVILFILPFFLPIISQSQNSALGVMLGGSNYQGDLAKTHVVFRETHVAGGIFIRRQILSKLTVKANFYMGKVQGTDDNFIDRASRGFKFKSVLLEGGINFEWDILGKIRNYRKGYYSRTVTPYLLTGFGAVYYNPKVSVKETSNSKFPQGQETTNENEAFNFIIPMGAGMKYDLTPRHTLGLEFVTHLPFTDYLDGISESAEPGNHDWYVFGGLTFQYWFGTPNLKMRDDKL